jgi:hypothetical protein
MAIIYARFRKTTVIKFSGQMVQHVSSESLQLDTVSGLQLATPQVRICVHGLL